MVSIFGEHRVDFMAERTTPVIRPLEPRRRAIVIGASSGVGAALVRRRRTRPALLAPLARREVELNNLSDAVNANFSDSSDPRVITYVHHATDFAAVPALFQDVVRDLGGLDLIAYVAGVQPAVAPNEYNFDKDAVMIQTNLLGAIA